MPKERILGTFKRSPKTSVVAIERRNSMGVSLTTYVQAFGERNTISRGQDKTLTDAQLIERLKNGPWADKFDQSGGVNWNE